MREFPLHKLAIPYNATMFTYDLLCGSSPYINWLYGTMAQCLRTIYHEGVPLHKVTIRNNCTMFTYDLPCGSSPYINWLYGTMPQCLRTNLPCLREFPLHKLTIRYNGTMFTYDLPCGSSPYINWLYGTMPQCLRTIYHAVVPLTLTIRYNAIMFTYDLPCGSSPSINWLYGTMPQCLRTIYHPGVPLTLLYRKLFTIYGTIDYTVQWCNVYVRFTMREFPLHKLTIRYNGTMFTYDLPCGSSPYINWLYGTMPRCLRTIYHAAVPLT